ncbi:DEAD/DEAH box helicase [Sphingobacterium daejeonense]|uniref:DEAD/DEAH box helicase n=1 Tax=Sphingobacterium daejeonense TaxID=371142 RepID=UPI0010C48690|nr:DEAD/DEAH box helicase [Sphingobacterium daejeonense]VTP98527.1 putative ATP-dependent helicase Lhr [Sphingobacterium daejeonense]
MKNEFAEVWFYNQGWQAHEFQQKCWEALANGESGILNAPTGYGKTFAIWFGVLAQYYAKEALQEKKIKKKTLHTLWITPLRALSKEIHKATSQVSQDLDLDYEIELRTGDTTVANRQRQRKNPPQALITTPESVHLILATKKVKIISNILNLSS